MAIVAARGGDPEGVHYLYVRFGGDVVDHVMPLIGDPDVCDRLTKDIFADLDAVITADKEQDERPFEARLFAEASRRAPSYPSRDSPPRDSARSISAT